MQWLMLQQQEAKDFVIATGEQHSVREFVSIAAEMLGLKLTWQGHGVEEKALDEKGNVVVAIDPAYFRPTEVETLLGDATRARVELGWTPRTSFLELVREMVDSDLESAERDALVRKHGYSAYNVRET
uniref:GDP-mannose 4,6-dehydratase n=1 Tax=mine drainage metagenome TaxID=410659 RepID=E6PZR6_9ZZZZ